MINIISYTKTVIAKGIVNDTREAIKDSVEAVKDTVEAVKYITTSYISNMVTTIFKNMCGR